MTAVPTHAVQPTGIVPSRYEQFCEALATTNRLDKVLNAAGVPDRPRMNDETLAITLPSLTTHEASAVATLMREGMSEFFAAAEALSKSAQDHGIPLFASVVRLKVDVAELSIHHADQLATLLGRPTPSDVDFDDFDDPATAQAVVDRLTGAIEDVTDGVVAADLMPACFCRDCGHGATVRLLPMTVQMAECLRCALSRPSPD